MILPSIITQNIPLAPYTTLGVGGSAEFFCEVTNERELREVVMWAQEHTQPITVMGSGSNILVSEAGVKGLVMRVCFSDIVYESHDDTAIQATVGAGVLLDHFVAELVSKKIWGLENLSAIPGTVGATPVQNVGAYGVEVSELITYVTVYDKETHMIFNLDTEACHFGYRESIFKSNEGKRYIILRVSFVLSNIPNPRLAYKDIQEYFHGEMVTDIARIREVIMVIRSGKFPDWNVIGTAGSFFKNPIISKAQFIQLQSAHPQIPGFPYEEDLVKISLGYVLDKICNLKGYREGGVALYENQALVLVCAKGTSWREVFQFSEKIIETVFLKTEIRIEREVTLLE